MSQYLKNEKADIYFGITNLGDCSKPFNESKKILKEACENMIVALMTKSPKRAIEQIKDISEECIKNNDITGYEDILKIIDNICYDN